MLARTSQWATAVFWLVLFFKGLAPVANVNASFVYEMNLAGMETFGGFMSTQNSSKQLSIFPFARVSKVEWIDLVFTTDNGSFLSELVLSLNDSENSGFGGTFWDDRPAMTLTHSGTYQGSGTFSKPALFGSGPFELLSDGILHFTVYETFDDEGNARDAFITQGTLRITVTAVPEPSSLLLVALPLAGLAWRTRTCILKNRTC